MEFPSVPLWESLNLYQIPTSIFVGIPSAPLWESHQYLYGNSLTSMGFPLILSRSSIILAEVPSVPLWESL